MTANSRNGLAKMLKQRRLLIELTLRQLGASSGVSSSHIGRIERGERFPSAWVLRKVAKPLGFEERELFTLAGYLSPQPSSVIESPSNRQLNPYVAKVLTVEKVPVRQQVLSLLLDYPNASYEKVGSIVHCSRQRVHQIARSAGLTRKIRPPHYRNDVTVEKVLELYHRDLLVKEIAPTLGCCLDTVTSRLREAGISPGECFSRSMKLDWRGKAHCRDDVTVERVLNLYHNDELLVKEIAQTLGCNQTTARSRLRQAGISKSECYSRGRRRRKQKA